MLISRSCFSLRRLCVANFEHVAPAVAVNAVDVILSDIYYWAGIHGVKALGVMCEAFRWGLSMHSGSELGVTLAAMLRTAAALPNLTHRRRRALPPPAR